MQIRGLVIFSFRNINFKMHLPLSRPFAHTRIHQQISFSVAAESRKQKRSKNSVKTPKIKTKMKFSVLNLDGKWRVVREVHLSERDTQTTNITPPRTRVNIAISNLIMCVCLYLSISHKRHAHIAAVAATCTAHSHYAIRVNAKRLSTSMKIAYDELFTFVVLSTDTHTQVQPQHTLRVREKTDKKRFSKLATIRRLRKKNAPEIANVCMRVRCTFDRQTKRQCTLKM